MGVKLADGTFNDSCLDKLAVGEPFFILRGQDKLAADLVEGWVEAVEEEYEDTDTEMSDATFEKLEAARELATAMRAWPKQKLPD